MSVVASRLSVRFVEPDADGIAEIVIDRSDDAVNAIDQQLIQDLVEAVRTVRGNEHARGVIITSAKPNQWLAGADLKLVTQAADAAQIESAGRQLRQTDARVRSSHRVGSFGRDRYSQPAPSDRALRRQTIWIPVSAKSKAPVRRTPRASRRDQRR